MTQTLSKTIPGMVSVVAILSMSFPAMSQTTETLPAYFEPSMPPSAVNGDCPSLPRPRITAPKRWWQQTDPPTLTDTCDTFAFGPLTDATDQPIAAFSTSKWTGGLWPRIWAKRGPRPPALGFGDPPSNPIYPYIHTPDCSQPGGPIDPQMDLGQDFSSFAKANAATEAEILHMLGASTSVWQAPLIAQGFNISTDLIYYTLLQANPGQYVNYSMGCNSHDTNSFVTVDKFIVHDEPGWVYISGKSTPPTGVMIDYEVNDFRSPPDGAMFLAQLANDIHSQAVGGVIPQAFLYTNPWQYIPLKNGVTGGMAANGFDFNSIDSVKSAFDYISLYLLDAQSNCNVNSAFSSEMANISGVSGVVKNSELVVTVDMGRCSQPDMIDIFQLNVAQQFGGYMIFPKNQNMGGQQLPLAGANLLLWSLLYGGKTPPS